MLWKTFFLRLESFLHTLMVSGDVEVDHNTSETCPWRIFPVQRAQLSEPWPMASIPDTRAASGKATSETSDAVRLLWLLMGINNTPWTAQSCKKVQNRWKILHFSLSSALFSTPTSTCPQWVKAYTLSLPDQLHFLLEAKQHLNFPAWKENLYLPVLLGHIIPVLTAKPIPHLDICEKDLTQSGCSLIWKVFWSDTPFLNYMGNSKGFLENISSLPASDLDSCDFVDLPATEPCSVENAVWIEPAGRNNRAVKKTQVQTGKQICF